MGAPATDHACRTDRAIANPSKRHAGSLGRDASFGGARRRPDAPEPADRDPDPGVQVRTRLTAGAEGIRTSSTRAREVGCWAPTAAKLNGSTKPAVDAHR